MNKQSDRKVLFEILLDGQAEGLTLIQGAPIHCSDDFLRARAELARISAAMTAPTLPSAHS